MQTIKNATDLRYPSQPSYIHRVGGKGNSVQLATGKNPKSFSSTTSSGHFHASTPLRKI